MFRSKSLRNETALLLISSYTHRKMKLKFAIRCNLFVALETFLFFTVTLYMCLSFLEQKEK